MPTQSDHSVRTRPEFAPWNLPLRPRIAGRLRPLLCALAVAAALLGVAGGGYLLANNQSSGFDHGGGFANHDR